MHLSRLLEVRRSLKVWGGGGGGGAVHVLAHSWRYKELLKGKSHTH